MARHVMIMIISSHLDHYFFSSFIIHVMVMLVASNRLELTTVGNDDLGTSLAALGAIALDSLDHFLALLDRAEHTMLAIQPGSRDGAEKELGAVGVGTSICHG